MSLIHGHSCEKERSGPPDILLPVSGSGWHNLLITTLDTREVLGNHSLPHREGWGWVSSLPNGRGWGWVFGGLGVGLLPPTHKKRPHFRETLALSS